MNNKYAIFYKTDKNSYWQSKRLTLPIDKWEDYCREQNYAQFEIKDLSTYSADDLHLLTDIVLFNGRYYLPEKKIDYPDSIPDDIKNFKIDMVMNEEYVNDEIDFDEVYNKQSICWNFGYLWTEITTKFIFPEKIVELALIAQEIVENLPVFTTKLNQNSFAVYINMEFSKFKWLAWIKDDKVRLIHQTYQEENPVTEFDVLVDKTWFFSFCEDMIKTMKNYADNDLKRYQEYALKKYGKINKDSIPYPETEPLNLGSFDIKTDIKYNDETDFDDFYKAKDKLYTVSWTYLTLAEKTEEVVLIAEQFADKFPDFIQELKQIENSVYEDYENTETKLYGWLKGDNARLVYQDFSSDEHEIIFDIMVKKDWFFETAEKLIKQMKEIASSEQKRYNEYVKEKYGEN